MTTISSPHPTTERLGEEHLWDGHPSHPHRRDTSDAGSRWNGPKPSDIGRDINSPIRHNAAPSQINHDRARGSAFIHIIPPSPPHRAAESELTPVRSKRRQPASSQLQEISSCHRCSRETTHHSFDRQRGMDTVPLLRHTATVSYTHLTLPTKA